MHLCGHLQDILDVWPVVGVRVDAGRHQVPQLAAVLVRRQGRVVALNSKIDVKLSGRKKGIVLLRVIIKKVVMVLKKKMAIRE